MGFIPIFLTLASFFFLWGAVIFYTFRNYRAQAQRALLERKDSVTQELAALPTPELLAKGRTGALPAAWQVEYTYRTARHRYNTLLAEAPYSVFARWFGFRRLA